MLVLLDECLPKKLCRELPGFKVFIPAQMGWASKQNGELLAAMKSAGFNVLITVDQKLVKQQNISASGIGVIVLGTRTNTPKDVLPLASRIIEALNSIQPGEIVSIRS